MFNLTYDGNKISSFANPDKSTKAVFTYTGDFVTNIKSYYENKLVTEITYTYILGKLMESDMIDHTPEEDITTNCIYSAPIGNIIKVSKTVKQGLDSYVIDINYNVQKGNIMSYEGIGEGVSDGKPTTYTESGSFTYDDKNGIFKNVPGFDKLLFTESFFDGEFSNVLNNITSYQTIFKSKKSGGSESVGYTYFKSTYEYNNKNFPNEKH